MVLRVDTGMTTLMDFRYKRKYAAQPGGNRVLSIVKNKEGERGAIELIFDAAHLRMAPLVSKSDTAADHDDEDDWPRMQAWPKADTGGDLP